MASREKREEIRQMNQQKIKERNYRAAREKLTPYPPVAIGFIAVVLLLFFVNWADIYNTDIAGTEVAVSGWSFLIAGITGNFASPSAIYGDLAVPFYYYAAAQCGPLALCTLLAFIAVAAGLALEIAATAKKAPGLNYAAGLVNLLAAALLIVCFSIALSMKSSDILPIYCSGNPACSIRSFAILPALFAIGAAVVNGIACRKLLKARKLLK